MRSIFFHFFSLFFILIQFEILAENDQEVFIQKEYSYESIIGLDLKINPTDFLILYQNGVFEYEVDAIKANGTWSVIQDVLQFHYNNPIDTIRNFEIIELSQNSITLLEGDVQFELRHRFSNKVNMFSKRINASFSPIVSSIGSVIFYDITNPFGANKNIPFIVVWLVFGAVFFTIKMNFINFRGFQHSIDLVRGDYSDPNNKGEVSHFQALTTALSGTVGLGNIAGVAIAISLGGPGATFWMIIAGLLGMSSKFVECTLGLKYRVIDKNGVVSGGPMYYLRD